MIKHLLSATFICAATLISAQQLNNNGFENWTGGNPDNWGSGDQVLTAAGLTGTTLETQVSPGSAGASACQLKTTSIPFVGVVPGVIASGPITSNGVTLTVQGAPFTGTPASYSFFYKFTPVNGDTAGTEVFFTKWNTSTNSRDTLGYGGMIYNTAASAFTQDIIPIAWLAAGTPDTATMMFLSSVGNPQANTTFIVDDVQMLYTTGVSEPFMPRYSVYPNPASDIVNINAADDAATKVLIYDITGRNVATEQFSGRKASVNTTALAEGIYIYRVYDANGNELKNSKFTVAR